MCELWCYPIILLERCATQVISNIIHYINYKSEDIALINLIFSTNGYLLCILLTSAFAKLKLFFVTFMKHFLQLYVSKIKSFSATSTTISSIKVKILIWSTWFFQQKVTFYASFWQVLLQSSNFFSSLLWSIFYSYTRPKFKFSPSHQPLNHP